MSDDAKPHSGSRWEPSPDGSDPAADPDTEATIQHAAVPSTDPDPAPSDTVAAQPPARRIRGRGLLLAATAVGLVVGSGLGGYAVGYAAGESGQARIGLVGDAGGYGTHRGGPPGMGGMQRSQNGNGTAPDSTAPDGTGTGTQSSGAGANGTGAST